MKALPAVECMSNARHNMPRIQATAAHQAHFTRIKSAAYCNVLLLAHCSLHVQEVPEFTDLSSKALEAAQVLQGLWADAWGSLNAASDSWSSLVSELKTDLVEGRKDINTVVDEVGGCMVPWPEGHVVYYTGALDRQLQLGFMCDVGYAACSVADGGARL